MIAYVKINRRDPLSYNQRFLIISLVYSEVEECPPISSVLTLP